MKNTPNWEKEFDERWTNCPNNPTALFGLGDIDAIKSFIRTLISLKEQEVEKGIVKYLDKRMSKLYCTADLLGYHNKNCEGLPCEKSVLQDLKQFLTKEPKI